MTERITLRISTEQKNELKERAEANGLNVSEYVITRLFIDPDSNEPIDQEAIQKHYDQDLIKGVMASFMMIQEVSLKMGITKEDLQETFQAAERMLDKKDYYN